MQCAILSKQRQNTSHNSKENFNNNMLKCIKYHENINLKLATGEQ